MSMTEKIRIVMVKRGNISAADLARRIGTSPQNLNNKLRRDNFSQNELKEIAKALNCEYRASLVLLDTGEEV